MAYPDSAYDVILNGKGYMLVRADASGNGPRRWSVESVGAANTQQQPSEGRWGNQPPTIETPFVWTGGDLGYGDKDRNAERRYHYALGIDARFPDRVILGPKYTVVGGTTDGPAKAFFEQNSMIFCVGGRYCHQIKTDNTLATAKDFGSGKSAMSATMFKGKAYIGMGYSEAFWERSSNATPTSGWNQADSLYIGHATVLDDAMWASATATTLKSVAANPMTAIDWSAPYAVGDPGTTITSMGALSDLIYIGKTDGLHALDNSGNAPCLTPELRAYDNALNCVGMKTWHGLWLVPHLRGFFSYQELGDSGFKITPLGPNHDLDSDNPVKGQVTAMVGDDRWLYIALWDGTYAYIVAGREARGDETKFGPVIWHPLCRVAEGQIGAMHITNLRSLPELFFSAGNKVCIMRLPKYSDDPQSDANYLYTSSGSLYLSYQDWQAPATIKAFKSIELEAENVSASSYISVYYKIGNASTWTNAGRVTISPRAVLPIASPTNMGLGIRLRIDFNYVGNTRPIVLRRVVVRAIERPRQVDVITMRVRCADGITLRNRTVCPRTGAQMLAELKALANDDTGIVSLVDLVGMGRQVVVLPPVSEQESQQAGELPREIVATVRMAVVQIAEPMLLRVKLRISGSPHEGAIPMEVPTPIGKKVADDYVTVNIEGSAATYGAITINGPITDLSITNTATGHKLSLPTIEIGANNWYKFDMNPGVKTVTDSFGTDRSGELSADSNLDSFIFRAGRNVLHITGTGTSAETKGTLEYAPKDA